MGTVLHGGSYLVDVLDMLHLGTLGGETDIECGVFLAVEREEQRKKVEKTATPSLGGQGAWARGNL